MRIAKTLAIQNCSLKFELTLSRLGIDAVFLMTLYRFLLPELTSKWHFPLSSSMFWANPTYGISFWFYRTSDARPSLAMVSRQTECEDACLIGDEKKRPPRRKKGMFTCVRPSSLGRPRGLCFLPSPFKCVLLSRCYMLFHLCYMYWE